MPALYRKKTCPCCRTHIVLRPIQLFIVKSLVASFAASETQASTPAADVVSDADPWAGIFLDDDLEFSEREYDEEVDGAIEFYDSDDGDGSYASSIGSRYLRLRIFSDEEEADEDNNSDASHSDDGDIYCLPSRAPPFYGRRVTRRVHPGATAEQLQLLQRGATAQMIARFRMRLDPEDGIVATTDDGNSIYLGWNIRRPDEDDEEGVAFMEWVELDIGDNFERWKVEENEFGGGFSIWRLVKEDEGNEVLGLDDQPEEEPRPVREYVF